MIVAESILLWTMISVIVTSEKSLVQMLWDNWGQTTVLH